MQSTTLSWMFVCVSLCACNADSTRTESGAESGTETLISGNDTPTASVNTAVITDLAVRGEANAYTFNVTVSSPDLGCSQYADWWEVITPDGQLIYRRILTHSHVDEQPFTRSGGPVGVAPDDNLVVRVHMNNTGYSEQVFTGNIERGFTVSVTEPTFAQTLEFVEPLPDGCAF